MPPPRLSSRLSQVLTPRLKGIAEALIQDLVRKYGASHVVVDSAIVPSIPYSPTVFVRPSKFEIIAYEVDEKVYPQALRISALDLKDAPITISGYSVCPIEVYQADKKEGEYRSLCRHGFGCLTVGEDLVITPKARATPLQQFVSEEEFAERCQSIPPNLIARIRLGYEIYLTAPLQGLQDISQLPEALLWRIYQFCERKKWTSGSAPTRIADVIDVLLSVSSIQNMRAALGGAADFFSSYRNPTSHTPRTPKAYLARLRACRDGFLNGVRVTERLAVGMKEYGIRIILPAS